MSLYEPYLTPVIRIYSTGKYRKEIVIAKEEYYERAGKIFEDDPDFESRMNTFMDWYLFDRDLPGVDLPPVKHFYDSKKGEYEKSEDEQVYLGLCNTIHSLFKMKRKTWNRKSVVVQDLFTKKVYTVAAPDIAKGFNRGDIFEARIIPFFDEYVFSNGFCFHPAEMARFILKEIKKVRFQDKFKKTKLILKLSQLKLRHQRFDHIDVRHNYRMD